MSRLLPIAVSLCLALPAFAAAPKIELLAPGAEPRVALRYQFKPGSQEKLVMDLGMSMSMQMGAMAQPPVTLPVSRMHMVLDLQSIDAAGELRYAFVMNKAEVLPATGAAAAMVPMMSSELAKMEGMKGTARVSNRGFTREASFEVPDRVSAQIKQMEESMARSIEQMSSPLPEEPVGVGARWRVTSQVETGGVNLNQIGHFELVALEAGVAKVRISLEQSAPPQDVKSPDLPPGTVVHLVSMKGQGTGEGQIDLARVVPTSKLELKTEMQMQVKAGPQEQSMGMGMGMSVHIRPE